MLHSVTEGVSVDADLFGARLRELRTEAGWTQAVLAERAGLEANSIARLERGEREPSWRTVVALVEALGVSVESFLKPPAKRPPAGPGRPPKGKPRPKGRGRKKGGRE
jgi:transcriptional regulator with XRE-family HTH domain